MKRISFLITAALAALSCNNNATTETAETATTPAENVEYAYKIDKPDNWERGSLKNVELVMNSLKAWENGNIDESLKYFADSVQLDFDNLSGKYSRDSVKAMFSGYRNDLSSMKITMDDWESVISKDKQDEWVSLWYKQEWTNKEGKTDSVYIMDDIKVKDGKIIRIDEKTRHFPAKK